MIKISGYLNFIDQCAQAIAEFPGLSSFSKDGVPGLAGNIELRNDDNNFIDVYTVEILATFDFPATFPLTFETGGRIPKNYDWHVYQTDGHCCIKTTPEEMLVCRTGIDLPGFIRDQIKPYLFNQTFRRLNGYFYQERSHGVRGWIEYFKEVFGTQDLKVIANGLKFIAKKEKPNRVSLCFCGIGKKYRKCHRGAYEELAVLSESQFAEIFQALGL